MWRGQALGSYDGSIGDFHTAGGRSDGGGAADPLRIWLEQAAVFQNVCCSIITYQQVLLSDCC